MLFIQAERGLNRVLSIQAAGFVSADGAIAEAVIELDSAFIFCYLRIFIEGRTDLPIESLRSHRFL